MKKLALALSCLALLAIGCHTSNDVNKQWDDAHLDPGLPKNLIYHGLDKQGEVYSFFEKHDQSKRTSNVSYFSHGIHKKEDTSSAKLNNCRVYYTDSDTLRIDIGINGPFGGHGLIVKYVNKKFNTEAYTYTDVVIDGEAAPYQKIIFQKLSLNKLNYQVGDSLFGKIDFQSTDYDRFGDTILHDGHGNFRALVKEKKAPKR